jgi:hypothetical protein
MRELIARFRSIATLRESGWHKIPAACPGTAARANPRQQPDGDWAPSVVVAPKGPPVVAKLEVPITDAPVHVVTERTGGGTDMSGLRPGAEAPDGTVASLKSGVGTVLGVSRGTGLPIKELVSVESAVARKAGSVMVAVEEEAGSVRVAVGLQMLDAVLVPNGVVIGSGRTRGGEPTEGLKRPGGDDGDGIKAALADAALAAAGLVGPRVVVGHVVIVPSDIPGNGANMPR